MNLAMRIQSALSNNQPHSYFDERELEPDGGKHSPAAVLIAITDRQEPGLILTQRPDWLKRHPGQIALPGGRIDLADADASAAALREAEEEIGLPRHVPNIIGRGADFYTRSGFLITPIISVIPPDLPFIAEPGEVAEIFEAPIRFLLDPQNMKRHLVDFEGQQREVIDIEWQNRRIWGITAGILFNLSKQIGLHN